LHTGERSEVTIEDVEATVTKTRQAKAFAFSDAVADRKLNSALLRLDEEIWSMRTDRQKSEMGLLYGLISKFRNMLLVKDLVVQGRLRAERSFASFRSQLASLDKDGFPSDRRFNPLSQNPYVIFRTVAQVGHYKQSELVRALASLMACNTRLISVGDDPSSILRECVIDIILGHQN
jgi:DNA polymerase III delta subunit